MIQNDVELQCTLERIAQFASWVAQFRVNMRPTEFKAMSGAYLAEIEKMHAEVLEYLSRHASETVTAEAA